MPIINGSYVPETLPNAQDAQRQVFGEYTKRDMTDYSQAAYNYLMKQQDQAYNLQMWNLTNQYNAPASQMQRFQDAGLNPNLIYSQNNTAQAPAAANPTKFQSSGTMGKAINTGINAASSMINGAQAIVKSARDTYDYLKYGAETSAWNRAIAREKSRALWLDNEFETYLQGMTDPETSPITGSWKLQGYQADVQSRQKALARATYVLENVLPLQAEGQRKLNALREQQHDKMESQFGAINTLDLGLGPEINKWARMFLFFALAKMF